MQPYNLQQTANLTSVCEKDIHRYQLLLVLGFKMVSQGPKVTGIRFTKSCNCMVVWDFSLVFLLFLKLSPTTCSLGCRLNVIAISTTWTLIIHAMYIPCIKNTMINTKKKHFTYKTFVPWAKVLTRVTLVFYYFQPQLHLWNNYKLKDNLQPIVFGSLWINWSLSEVSNTRLSNQSLFSILWRRNISWIEQIFFTLVKFYKVKF